MISRFLLHRARTIGLIFVLFTATAISVPTIQAGTSAPPARNLLAVTNTYNSSGAVAIPDGLTACATGVSTPGAAATSTINVSDALVITDVNVGLNISHTWVGDVQVTLTSPGGTTLTLVDRVGYPFPNALCGRSSNHITTTLDDSAATPVENSNPPTGPTYSPNQPLSGLNGQTANGTWTLTVRDFSLGVTGTINSWSLIITGSYAPVAVNDAYSTDQDTALNVVAPGVLGNDTDADGDPLTAVLVTGPTHGTLVFNANGSFTYTPTAGYNGPDSFTYRANDGTHNSNTATVNLTVNPPANTPPVANDDNYNTPQDTPLNVAAPGVLGNDTDANGDPLTAVLDAGPTHGTLTLNANGSFSYTPTAGYNGPDSFTYHANDGTADGNTATVNLTVNPPGNTPPVSNDDAYNTSVDTPLNIAAPGVLGNDTDADGDPLTANLVTGPTHGTLTLNTNGSFDYTPSAGYSGPDSFTYHASDPTGPGNVATVSITVAAAPAPGAGSGDANADFVITGPQQAVVIDVLANDNGATAIGGVTPPSHGTAVVQGNSVLYTPGPFFTGDDAFYYDITGGGRAMVTVRIWKPVPLCADFDGSQSGVVRASVPGGTVTGGGVYCRVLVENQAFVQPAGEIGVASIINLGILQAVEVFGMLPDGTAAPAFNNGLTVCLLGEGKLIFLNALTMPRAASWVTTFQAGGFTCGGIPNAGTVIMVPNVE
jgi:VCBS repeat-containing protein